MRQQWRVRRAEGRTLRERNKEIIDKTGAPAFHAESSALDFLDLHLRKNKTATAEFTALVTHCRPAAIKPPIPKREDENVREPKRRSGT